MYNLEQTVLPISVNAKEHLQEIRWTVFTGAPMKPTARLHLIKQRQYRKQCPPGVSVRILSSRVCPLRKLNPVGIMNTCAVISVKRIFLRGMTRVLNLKKNLHKMKVLRKTLRQTLKRTTATYAYACAWDESQLGGRDGGWDGRHDGTDG